MKHAILIPTRHRPANMSRVFHSAMATAKNKSDIIFVFYIDLGDETSVKMVNLLNKYYQNVYLIVGERGDGNLSQMWNECYKLAEDKAEVFMHCGDDIVFRSNDWDIKVEEAINTKPDKIVLVHGRDGFHDARFGTHCWLHKNWVEASGFFLPPYFSSDWNDQWLNDVANALGRRSFREDIYTEHMHYVFNKAVKDQNTIDRENRGAKDNVQQMYRDTESERQTNITKLMDFIGNYK